MGQTKVKVDRRYQKLVNKNSGGMFTVGEGQTAMENIGA